MSRDAVGVKGCCQGMLLWGLFIVCSILEVTSVVAATTHQPNFTVEIITLGFVHPTSTSSLVYNGPGFDTAVRDVRRKFRTSFNITHTVLFDPIVKDCWDMGDHCDEMVGRYFYRRSVLPNMTVLIVPGCADAVYLNKLAAQWNLLFITGVVADPVLRDKNLAPTWITTTPVQVPSFVAIFLAILQKFNWTTVYFVSDEKANPFYVGFAASLSAAFKARGHHGSRWVTNSARSTDYGDVLEDFRKISRICVFLGHAFHMKLFLTYFGLDTFHNANFGGFMWENVNISSESVLRRALKSVLLIGLGRSTSRIKPASLRLEKEWMDLSRDHYNFTYPQNEKPTPYVTGCYAAVEVFAQVLNESLTMGNNSRFDPADGRAFARRFFSRTFATSVANIQLDRSGDRKVTLLLQSFQADINYTFLELQPAMVYFGSNDTLLELAQIQWLNGAGPPPNEPLCGYQYQRSSCAQLSGSRTVTIAAVVCSMVGIFVVALLAAWVLRRLRKHSSSEQIIWWWLQSECLVAFRVSREESSFLSSCATLQAVPD
ncbi:hypothetical protein BV898_15607 [Hypsibius exemplaris]|uniref:Receptor ligand binding region domain-containing protein n=1 Tax=Hypsibius exemplaris TaxID=2072580 RepID=A0A9X6RKE3_HYPEX|nr:hypothetical protein BV898_15607 [Hypsibius exemplaris]